MARLETTISVTGLGVAVGAAEGEEVGGEECEHVVREVGRSRGGRGEALTPLHARRRSSDQLVAGLPGRSPIRKPL